MTSLEALSHQINSDHAADLAANLKKGSANSPKKIRNPELSLPAAPAPAAQRAAAKEIKEVTKKLEQKTEEHEAEELYRKCVNYLEDEHLKPYLNERILSTKLSNKDSLQDLKKLHASIISALKQKHKQMFFCALFDQFANFSEVGLVQVMQRAEKRGLASFLIQNKELILQPELSELVIELPDDYLPGPAVRLGLKLAQLVAGFDSSQFQQQQQQQEAEPQEGFSNNDDSAANTAEDATTGERSLRRSSSSSSTPSPSPALGSSKRFPQKNLSRRNKSST